MTSKILPHPRLSLEGGLAMLIFGLKSGLWPQFARISHLHKTDSGGFI
jgi:hypothetical protein